jgi:hypothetical protein
MRSRPLIRSAICAWPAVVAAIAASVALGAGAIGPHAAGGFRTAHLGGSQVWTVSAPRLRRAHPGVVWDMAWRCRQPGQRIVSVAWQALRYAPPSGLLMRVTADGRVVWRTPDALLAQSPAPGRPYRVAIRPSGACDVHLQLVQVQAREQHPRTYWIGGPDARVVAPPRVHPITRASRLLTPARLVAGRRTPVGWRRDPRASYYNLQLYRGERKVLSTFPTAPRDRIAGRLLRPGRYVLRIWSGLGRQRLGRYATTPWVVRAFTIPPARTG